MRPWNLTEVNYGQVKAGPMYEVAVLPLGATEPHNLHLPYGTDTIQVDRIGELACERAYNAGARVILLPAIPYGTETNQLKFPLAMNLNPTTLGAVIADLMDSLARHGIRKLVLLNGHGGNDLKWFLRQHHHTSPVHLFLCDWFRLAADRYKDVFEDAGDHAGEMETSLIMAYRPELVNAAAADDGAMAETRFAAVNNGWISITRPWHLLTTNSGAGNPHPATPEKGHKITEIVVDRIAGFLKELSDSPLDDRFPY